MNRFDDNIKMNCRKISIFLYLLPIYTARKRTSVDNI